MDHQPHQIKPCQARFLGCCSYNVPSYLPDIDFTEEMLEQRIILYKKDEGSELLYSQNRESRSVCRIQVDGIGDFVQNYQPVYNPILTVDK